MSSLNSVKSASDIQMDYMKLLTEQLKNQNPMEPMDNQQMASQLAQFSSLQQLENINGNFDEVLSAVQFSYGSSLVGKEVSFLVEGEQGDGEGEQGEGESEQGEAELQTGVVEGIFKDIEDGDKMKAVIGDKTVALEDIVSINGQTD